jgi:H+/Cl- antiporter ClcA
MDTDGARHRDVAPHAAESQRRLELASWRAWRCHLAWLVAALLSGAGALLFNYADRYGGALVQQAQAASPWIPFAMVSLGMMVISWVHDRFFPGTEGTGIPQAIAALKMEEGPERAYLLSPRIAFGKMLLLVLALFLGPTIGREGPSVHVGACFLYLSRRFADFPRHLVERGLILAGSAAGIAAAFNAPIAGIVFAFEEIGRSFEKDNAGTIVRTAIIACLVSIAAFGDYLFYGRLDLSSPNVEKWLAVPVIGLIGGFLGGGFASALLWVTPRYRRMYRARPLPAALALGLGLGVLGLLSDGLSYGSGYQEAKRVLMDGAMLPWWFLPTHATASFLTLASGIPGGLFDPTLTSGAALGQLLAPLFTVLEQRETVLLFMVSFFCGVVQSPITSAVILVEMTSARFFVLPLAAAAIVAYEASRLACPTSLYEALAEIFLARLRDVAPADRQAHPA